MITLIYRKRDRLIAGASYPRDTASQTAKAVITEVRNICNSELGGIPGDYGTVNTEGAPESGMVPSINVDFSVDWSFVTDAATLDRARTSELLAVGSPSWTPDEQRELLEILARRI